jgi:hypothetical protein
VDWHSVRMLSSGVPGDSAGRYRTALGLDLDLFNDRRPAPPPAFMAGHDYRFLRPDQVTDFLSKLSVTHDAPAPSRWTRATSAPTRRPCSPTTA